MKKSIKKATAKRRTKRTIRRVIEPITNLILDALDGFRYSNKERIKLKKLENQKGYLNKEIQSRLDIMKYKDMLLPSEKSRLEAEIAEREVELKSINDKHNLITGRRTNRRKKKITAMLLMLGLCSATALITYLIGTGILTTLGY